MPYDNTSLLSTYYITFIMGMGMKPKRTVVKGATRSPQDTATSLLPQYPGATAVKVQCEGNIAPTHRFRVLESGLLAAVQRI